MFASSIHIRFISSSSPFPAATSRATPFVCEPMRFSIICVLAYGSAMETFAESPSCLFLHLCRKSWCLIMIDICNGAYVSHFRNVRFFGECSRDVFWRIVSAYTSFLWLQACFHTVFVLAPVAEMVCPTPPSTTG